MTFQNQELYNALQHVSTKASTLETYRELFERAEHELANAKEKARKILEALPGEQLDQLVALPIEHGDTIIHLALDSEEGAVSIAVSQEPERRSLHDLMGDEERAAVRQRVDAANRARFEQQQANQEGATHG
ncbi:MAG: hypothetical protein ACQEXI_00195 [Pseudomonadota bacterium]